MPPPLRASIPGQRPGWDQHPYIKPLRGVTYEQNYVTPFQTSEPVRQVNLLIFMQHYLQPRQAMIRAVLMMPDIFVHHMELYLSNT